MKILIIFFGLTIFSLTEINFIDKDRILGRSQNAEPDYQVAVKFINDYVGFVNDQHSEIRITDWVNNRNDVTNSFKRELKRTLDEAEKNDPELGLGFDPILDAQDNPNKFEIDKHESEYVVVRGVDWPEFRLTLKLKNIKNKWLVDGSGIINVPKNKQIER